MYRMIQIVCSLTGSLTSRHLISSDIKSTVCRLDEHSLALILQDFIRSTYIPDKSSQSFYQRLERSGQVISPTDKPCKLRNHSGTCPCNKHSHTSYTSVYSVQTVIYKAIGPCFLIYIFLSYYPSCSSETVEILN